MACWQHLAFVALCVVALLPASASTLPGYDRVLLPLGATPVEGAQGSRWVAETWFLYTGNEVTEVRPRSYICLITCVDPAESQRVVPGAPPRRVGISGSPGIFLYLPTRHAGEFVFQSLLYETSRSFSPGGTAIPIPRDCEFRRSTHLLKVPRVSGSRILVRIYGVPEAADPVVRVRYFAPVHPGDPFSPPPLLREETLRLASHPPTLDGLWLQPSYGVVANVESYPELALYDSVSIEIAAASPDLRVWAMASVTDNVTQNVTIVAPQVPCRGE